MLEKIFVTIFAIGLAFFTIYFIIVLFAYGKYFLNYDKEREKRLEKLLMDSDESELSQETTMKEYYNNRRDNNARCAVDVYGEMLPEQNLPGTIWRYVKAFLTLVSYLAVITLVVGIIIYLVWS